MRKVFILCVIGFCVCVMTGCKFLKKKRPSLEQTPSVTKVESMELAHEILRPKPYRITTARDPFKPVIEQKKISVQGMEGEPQETLEAKLIGIVLLGDTHTALIETSLGVKIFRQGDNIDSYVIHKIEAKSVFLKRGTNEIVLKVGGEENE